MLAKKLRSRVPSYLQQRPSGFYFRFALPIPYRSLLGCRELVRVIHASSRQEALHKANIAAYRLRCLFEKGLMDTTKLRQIIDTYLRESLDTDEHERATGGFVSREEREVGADGLGDVIDDYRDALRENDLKIIKRHAQELADTYKLALGPEEFAVWSREVLKAEIKLLAIVRQRERGDYGFERQVLNSPVTAAHVSNLKDTTAPSPRLSEVIGAYVKEMLQVGKWRLKTEADHSRRFPRREIN